MKIYRITLRVKPAPHHPLYWEMQFAHLMVWLFAKDPETAGLAGMDVAKAMPFESFGGKAVVIEAALQNDPDLDRQFERAKSYGFAWDLRKFEPGVDEEKLMGEFGEYIENRPERDDE